MHNETWVSKVAHGCLLFIPSKKIFLGRDFLGVLGLFGVKSGLFMGPKLAKWINLLL